MSPVFFFLFAAIGAMAPFVSVYYHRMGLSGVEISILMSVNPVLLLLSQPIFAPLTDRSGNRGRVLAWLLVTAAATGALLALGNSFWTLLPLILLWAFFSGPLVSIGDSVALGEVVRTGVSYPRLRLWGSIGFLVATGVLGRLYSVFDLRVSFAAYAVLNLVAWHYARRIPADGVTGQRPGWAQVKRLVANKYLLALLFCSGVLQTANAAHSVFFGMHMEAVGGSSTMLGLAWSLAALTEVPVWWVLGSVTRRTGPLVLLALAGVAFALRWWLYGMAGAPGQLIWLQLFQACTFAIFMPTSVTLVGELTPPELRTSGQALLAITNGGVATVLGTLGAGYIVDVAGTAGLYRVMAVVSLVSGLGFLALLVKRAAAGRGLANG